MLGTRVLAGDGLKCRVILSFRPGSNYVK